MAGLTQAFSLLCFSFQIKTQSEENELTTGHYIIWNKGRPSQIVRALI